MKYRKTLYLKFILAYLAFGLISFVLIATLFSKLTLDHLIKEKAAASQRGMPTAFMMRQWGPKM